MFGEASGKTATSVERYDDYCFLLSPLNPSELTPNGINGVSFGPLFSLQRNGLGLGDDEGIAFAFDDFDGEANNVAGGATDLLFATDCDNVGSNRPAALSVSSGCSATRPGRASVLARTATSRSAMTCSRHRPIRC
ncbi:MAG: hypothetical protein IPF53_19040 [Blastocatellia bacterium]|nr:hypothetical protein [Blastocatellia bacterium]